MRALVWSDLARTDLDAIWDFYAVEADLDVAERVVRRLHDRIGMLSEFPEAGRAADALRPGLRALTIAPYVVFYIAKQDVLEILRVLHGHQDQVRAFDEADD